MVIKNAYIWKTGLPPNAKKFALKFSVDCYYLRLTEEQAKVIKELGPDVRVSKSDTFEYLVRVYPAFNNIDEKDFLERKDIDIQLYFRELHAPGDHSKVVKTIVCFEIMKEEESC